MRIGIREQLAAAVLLCATIPLAVLAISVWIFNDDFVVAVTGNELTLTASLKAAQIASDLVLIQSTCSTIVTRILLQNALIDFYSDGPATINWTAPAADLQGALKSGGFSSLLQTIVYSRNATTNGNGKGLLNATATSNGVYVGTYSNGSYISLGASDSPLGFPDTLYPNITYTITNTPDPLDPSINATLATAFTDFPLNSTSALLLGPFSINDSYALVSLTLPVIDNRDPTKNEILGFMTVVAAASSLISAVSSREGMETTGAALIIGPSRKTNLFETAQRPASASYTPKTTDALSQALVHFVLPPANGSTGGDRHTVYNNNLSLHGSSNFTLSAYPAALAGFAIYDSKAINNAHSDLSTHNENNVSVAVGYARPSSTLVEWLVIVEQAHSEAWGPITKLRNIVYACVFGALGLILIIVLPMAHFSVRPIRRLRDATEKSIAPPGYTPDDGSVRSDISGDELAEMENGTNGSIPSKKGLFVRLRNLTPGSRRKTAGQRSEDERRRVFKIPGKVADRKHWINDELTDLTTTFNSMSDELMLQYSSLEERVATRTEELEVAKKAAEAANESKTLFIANISHELKTPLNGILGMCSVCMCETDLDKIKRSLQIVYKSGDLLLHLLNDLLLFSKNQIGQQVSLEEKEFRLADIKTQVQTIFHTQVQEGKIAFSVEFIGVDPEFENNEDVGPKLPALGPQGTGRLKDMCLWGDQHRILQVIINLVSNSLKFTPEGGKVQVRIKCLGEVEQKSDGTRNSMGSGSKRSSQRTPRSRQQQHDSVSNSSQLSRNPAGTALVINPMDARATPRVQVREREPTPPPSNARTLLFQFEIEDSGPGIPPAMRDKVFEPFVQGDLGLSKKYGGTGLGLSICSQLANLMGGSIALESEEGMGSTFTMKIPLKHTKSRAASTSSSDAHISRSNSASGETRHARVSSPKRGGDTRPDKDPQPRLVGLSQPFFASGPSPSPKDADKQLAVLAGAAASKEPGSRLRVLVAEDNLVNQEVVLRMLKLEDVYDVVVAKDGQEAYEQVKKSMSKDESFDLIFMDIQMPNLDGLQSTRLIREMGYSAPIVALTAFSEESNIKDCYDSGMNHFLSKPIRRPALKQVLKQFATIPEENESNSLTKSSTKSESRAPTPPLKAELIQPTANGISH